MVDDFAVEFHHPGKGRLEPAGMHFQRQPVDSDIKGLDMPFRVKGRDNRIIQTGVLIWKRELQRYGLNTMERENS